VVATEKQTRQELVAMMAATLDDTLDDCVSQPAVAFEPTEEDWVEDRSYTLFHVMPSRRGR
jgi:hypothetical protein